MAWWSRATRIITCRYARGDGEHVSGASFWYWHTWTREIAAGTIADPGSLKAKDKTMGDVAAC
ncbi:hypothetical protein JHK86_017772 [Glycine max]|nr:hypothetical protein JHK86_017772 [Glycine max]